MSDGVVEDLCQISFIPLCLFFMSLLSIHVLDSSLSNDCSELRSQIYGILQGFATPDEIAMSSGSQLNWTRVITQECPINLQVQLKRKSKAFKKVESFSVFFRLSSNQ